MKPLMQSDIYGGETVEEAAQIFMKVLENKATEAQKNVVIANASTAISVAKDISIIKAIAVARESLESGKALKSFEKLMKLKA